MVAWEHQVVHSQVAAEHQAVHSQVAEASLWAALLPAAEHQAVHLQVAEASLWAALLPAQAEFLWEVWAVLFMSVEEVIAAVVVQVPSWQAAGIVVL